jgi:hypothetical protein
VRGGKGMKGELSCYFDVMRIMLRKFTKKKRHPNKTKLKSQRPNHSQNNNNSKKRSRTEKRRNRPAKKNPKLFFFSPNPR